MIDKGFHRRIKLWEIAEYSRDFFVTYRKRGRLLPPPLGWLWVKEMGPPKILILNSVRRGLREARLSVPMRP